MSTSNSGDPPHSLPLATVTLSSSSKTVCLHRDSLESSRTGLTFNGIDAFSSCGDDGFSSITGGGNTRQDRWTTTACHVYADGRIYFFSKEGKMSVNSAAREFQLLATNNFDEGFIASPAIAGNTMILRSLTHLYRIEK